MVVQADADGATDIRDLDRLYSQLLNHAVKRDEYPHIVGIALGSRAHLETASVSKRAFYRTVLMYGFHVLVYIFCTKSIRDTQCGFKLFTRQAAKLLFPNIHLERWAFDIELIYLADHLHIPMVEVSLIHYFV